MNRQDIVVSLVAHGPDGAAPSVAGLEGHGARPVVVLRDAEEFASFLESADAASITVIAAWPDLTADLLRRLAEWAAERPGRGCGVIPSDSVPRERPRPPGGPRQALVASFDGFGMLAGGSLAELAPAAFEAALDTPDIVLAITGHGGEHCITLGGDWIGTYPEAGLPGRRIPPDSIRCAAALLNTCGSLRLGDSVVPRQLSLAARLFAQGGAVIGAYHNQFALPDAALLFARDVLAGLPLGRIVGRLNRESRARGNPATSYQLLGDAITVLGDGAAWPEPPSRTLSRPASAPLVEEMGWLEQVDATIGGWVETRPVEGAARAPWRRAVRNLYTAARESARAVLSDEEVAAIEDDARDAARAFRADLLEELASHSLAGAWPQTLCSPVSAPATHHAARCPRCGSRVLQHGFSPRRPGLLSLRSEDCDRCGTIRDVIGEAPEPVRLEAAVEDGAIGLRLPALEAGCTGRALVYRSVSLPPVPWPARGGIVRFPVAGIPFRGKTTLIASQLGPAHLSITYTTLFVDPSL